MNTSVLETDIFYSNIVNKVLKYICNIRKIEKKSSPLIDIIYNFCLKEDLDPELVGDAIRNDVYLTELIMDECRAKRMIKVERKVSSNDW